MNWDAIGAIGEIIGAAAVVLTLFYLAVQIRQSNRLSSFQTARDIFAIFDDNNRIVVENQDLRMLAFVPLDAQTEEQTKQLKAFVVRQTNVLINLQTAYDQGLMDDALFAAGKLSLRGFMNDWPGITPILAQLSVEYPMLYEQEIFEELHKALRESEVDI